MTAAGLRAREWVPHGRDVMSTAFFSTPGIERLYSGGWGDEQQRIGGLDLLLEMATSGRIVAIEVLVVQRQVADAHMLEAEVFRGQPRASRLLIESLRRLPTSTAT